MEHDPLAELFVLEGEQASGLTRAAAVGNSYVVSLAKLGVREVRAKFQPRSSRFCCFSAKHFGLDRLLQYLVVGLLKQNAECCRCAFFPAWRCLQLPSPAFIGRV